MTTTKTNQSQNQSRNESQNQSQHQPQNKSKNQQQNQSENEEYDEDGDIQFTEDDMKMWKKLGISLLISMWMDQMERDQIQW